MIPAAIVVTVALIAVGMLGVASAEAPTTTSTTTTVSPPPPTVSVQGVATEPIEQSASAATATTVYRQGMADAIGDGQTKAQFLAGKAGATLGSVQSIVEDGGYIECASEEEYLGEQPDFGSPGVAEAVPGVSTPRAVTEAPAAKARKPVVRKPVKKRRKSKKPKAKSAAVTGCALSTQVSLVYTLS